MPTIFTLNVGGAERIHARQRASLWEFMASHSECENSALSIATRRLVGAAPERGHRQREAMPPVLKQAL
jgi:hypothetical protein